MSEKYGNCQKQGKEGSFKSRKCRKRRQCKSMKLLPRGGAVSILVKGCKQGNIISHKECNFCSRRVNFHFGLSDTDRETLPKSQNCYFPQGGSIHGLGLGLASGWLAQQVDHLLNKSSKFIKGCFQLHLIVWFVNVLVLSEAKLPVWVMSLGSLGWCTPSLHSLLFSPVPIFSEDYREPRSSHIRFSSSSDSKYLSIEVKLQCRKLHLCSQVSVECYFRASNS